MRTDDEEMNQAAGAWDRYNHTPYAPYCSFPEYIGWTVEQYAHWLNTGEKPEGWKLPEILWTTGN